MQFFFEVLIGGLLSGAMYSLVALGFVLIRAAVVNNRRYLVWVPFLFQWFGFCLLALGFVVALFVGYLNGWITIQFSIPSFVTTLGMMFMARSAAPPPSRKRCASMSPSAGRWWRASSAPPR